MIRRGDIVQILPEWAEDGENRFVRVAAEDEDGGRMRVVTLLGWPINPSEIFSASMLQVITPAPVPPGA